MSRRRTSTAANPSLIGASTTLVILVAVFLAYNANNGCRSSPPPDVELDDFFDTFDDKTRAASQQELLGFGDAFAGRWPG